MNSSLLQRRPETPAHISATTESPGESTGNVIPRAAVPGQARRFWRALTRTRASSATAIARITLGVVILPHGAQKLLGWFGGYGFEGTMQFFTVTMGLPSWLAATVIFTEFFGGLALIAGAAARVAALGVGSIMVSAMLMVHKSHGFFANWEGNQAGEGIEFHLLAVALALVVLINGAGSVSVDRRLWRKRNSPMTEPKVMPALQRPYLS
jgi:putative oxidoreductase